MIQIQHWFLCDCILVSSGCLAINKAEGLGAVAPKWPIRSRLALQPGASARSLSRLASSLASSSPTKLWTLLSYNPPSGPESFQSLGARVSAIYHQLR
jgi:hypothetical protein